MDLEFRRPDGRDIQTNSKFWEDLDDEEMILATAKTVL